MGACATLKAEGFTFFLELGAPLVLVLETYARHPAGKQPIIGCSRTRDMLCPTR